MQDGIGASANGARLSIGERKSSYTAVGVSAPNRKTVNIIQPFFFFTMTYHGNENFSHTIIPSLAIPSLFLFLSHSFLKFHCKFLSHSRQLVKVQKDHFDIGR